MTAIDTAALPDLLRPFAFLLGTWRGEGVGGYPTLEHDFRYGQEVSFDFYGKPLLAYSSRTWALDDERAMARETGYWRPTSPTDIEVVLAQPSGLVEVLYGRLLGGSAGERIEMESDLIGHTATAKRVDVDKRMYAVRDGRLMYAMDLAAVGQGLHPHLSAALDRVT